MVKFIFSALTLAIVLGCAHTEKKATSSTSLPPNNLTKEEAELRASIVSDVQYNLDFTFTESGNTFKGVETINFKTSKNTERLTLDFYYAKIISLKLNGNPAAYRYNNLKIEFPSATYAEGNNTLVIEYEREFTKSGNGMTRFEDPQDKKVYLTTQFEPFDANKVFAAFDQPDIKATFELKVTAPSSWTVISTMRETKVDKDANKNSVWTFPHTPKISTYAFAILAGPYAKWESKAGNIPLRLFARQSLAPYVNQQEWFGTTQKGLAFFAKYFGYPYPYQKLDQILVPEFTFGGMENIGAITYNEKFLSRGKKSELERFNQADVILHEIAHMWFGNLVTMKWWNDLWLNESFATYLSFLALADTQPEFKNVWRNFYTMKGWAYFEDQLSTTHPIESKAQNTGDAFANIDGITYAKGASVLKQIHFLLGDEKFQKGLQLYFQRNAWKNTELKDFMAALSEASNRDLKEWQKMWLQEAGVNTLEARWNCDGGKIQKLEILQTAPADYNVLRTHKLQIALFDKKVGKAPAKKSEPTPISFPLAKVLSVEINGKSTGVIEAKGLTCPAAVYPNYNDHAYAKVKLDEKSLEALKANVAGIETPFVRQMVWVSLWEMVREAQMNVLEYYYLALRQGLQVEKDPDILRNLINNMIGRRESNVAVLNYLPRELSNEKPEYKDLLERIEDVSWRRLKEAPAGSEEQSIWFDSFSAVAETKMALDNVIALLDRRVQLPGFVLDQDKRWRLVRRLARAGHRDAEAYAQKESIKDNTHFGKIEALAAKSLIPDWSNKEKLIADLKNPKSDLSYEQKEVIMRTLFPRNQVELKEKYANQFYEDMAYVNNNQDVEIASSFTALAPDECRTKNITALKSFVTRTKLEPVVQKELKGRVEEGERCVKIIALARQGYKPPDLPMDPAPKRKKRYHRRSKRR